MFGLDEGNEIPLMLMRNHFPFLFTSYLTLTIFGKAILTPTNIRQKISCYLPSIYKSRISSIKILHLHSTRKNFFIKYEIC